VPGPIDAPSSAGSNELLRDGAVVIAAVADALALLGLPDGALRRSAPAGGDERVLWNALEVPACDLDTLAARTALPARRCMAALTALELAGSVECALTGEIRRR
jgi:predicted Rossmann fold nucleotide-binding protein DprA/Smf involved in DNA uptake